MKSILQPRFVMDRPMKGHTMKEETTFDADLLRSEADAICKAVESDARVVLFKCADCDKLHMRVLYPPSH